ncbi:MAG: hypothetical protein ACRD5M_15840 [Candidatus Acidiferrales bacterium]
MKNGRKCFQVIGRIAALDGFSLSFSQCLVYYGLHMQVGIVASSWLADHIRGDFCGFGEN